MTSEERIEKLERKTGDMDRALDVYRGHIQNLANELDDLKKRVEKLEGRKKD